MTKRELNDAVAKRPRQNELWLAVSWVTDDHLLGVLLT